MKNQFVPNHFTLIINNNTYVYNYIRKNACSAFKQLFLEQSPFSKEYTGGNPIYFMSKYHRTTWEDCLDKKATFILVIRNPFLRLISLYCNKFIEDKANSDIFKNYYNLTGKEPRNSSFIEFIDEYIGKFPFNRLDPHILPQSVYMQQWNYNAPIMFEHLYEDIQAVMGIDISNSYFKKKVNSVNYSTDTNHHFSAYTLLTKLQAFYKNTDASVPNPSIFYCQNLTDLVNSKYSLDLHLFNQLNNNYNKASTITLTSTNYSVPK